MVISHGVKEVGKPSTPFRFKFRIVLFGSSVLASLAGWALLLSRLASPWDGVGLILMIGGLVAIIVLVILIGKRYEKEGADKVLPHGEWGIPGVG